MSSQGTPANECSRLRVHPKLMRRQCGCSTISQTVRRRSVSVGSQWSRFERRRSEKSRERTGKIQWPVSVISVNRVDPRKISIYSPHSNLSHGRTLDVSSLLKSVNMPELLLPNPRLKDSQIQTRSKYLSISFEQSPLTNPFHKLINNNYWSTIPRTHSRVDFLKYAVPAVRPSSIPFRSLPLLPTMHCPSYCTCLPFAMLLFFSFLFVFAQL